MTNPNNANPSSKLEEPESLSQEVYAIDLAETPRGAWRAVAGAFLLQFCAVGLVQSFGVFQDFYTKTWLSNSSSSDVSWIGTTALFLELGLSAPAGKLFDAGYFRVTVYAGCVILLTSFFMLSLTEAHHYYQVFLSQGLGVGLGLGLIYMPTSALIGRVYKTRRALAMGIVSSSAPLGGAIFPVILNNLIHGRAGFPWAVRVCGFMTLGLFVLGIFLLIGWDKPSPISLEKSIAKQTNKASYIRDPAYMLTLAGGFLGSLGTWFPNLFVQLYADTHGISPNVAFYSLTIMNLACVVGRIVPNHFADKYGAMNLYPLCLGLNALGALAFAMLGCSHLVGLVFFCLLYGFFFGATISMFLPLIAALTPSELDIGTSIGISVVPAGVATLIGSPISGILLGVDSWWKGVTFSAVCMIGASGLILIARQIHLKRHGK